MIIFPFLSILPLLTKHQPKNVCFKHQNMTQPAWNNGSGLKKQQQLMMGEESKSEKVPKKPTKHCLRNSFYRETLNVLSPISDY